MQFHFIYIGLDLLHFCIKVCYAERSEAKVFIFMKNAVVLNEVKQGFVVWFYIIKNAVVANAVSWV